MTDKGMIRQTDRRRSVQLGTYAHCVIEISGGGGEKKLLEILCNVIQRPVGHDQRTYSFSMLTRQKGGISVK